MAPLIEMLGIERTYVMGDNLVRALAGVDLVIERGASIAIMGTSGSGKSTLMNIMGCLDQPTKGTYFLNGKDVSRLTRAELADVRSRTIGFVFQSFNLLARQTTLENVALPLLYAGVRKAKDRAMEALDAVGLANRAHHKPTEISGGQKQRVAIARALVTNPPVILADEPTGNLDTRTGEEILELFAQLNRNGTTVVIVTHERDVAEHSGRILTIRDGRVSSDERVAKPRIASEIIATLPRPEIALVSAAA